MMHSQLVMEDQKSSVSRECNDLRSTLRDTESSRMAARRELHSASSQLKQVAGERQTVASRCEELQTHLQRETEKADELRAQLLHTKQLLIEGEATKEGMKYVWIATSGLE